MNEAAFFAQVSVSFIRKWKTVFKTEGKVSPYTLWGHHSKYVTIFDHEDKILQAKTWIRNNSNVKGEVALTAEKFAHYCNTTLMKDLVDDPESKFNGISAETARRWLNKLGFEYSSKTGLYNDGHERPEVRLYRTQYLKFMLAHQERGYLYDNKGEHLDKWTDLSFRNRYKMGGLLKKNVKKPVIIVFHDESIYCVNDGKQRFWQDSLTSTMKSKGRGYGIMVSDFVTEQGFLGDNIDESLRIYLEYNKQGHWTHDRLKQQVLHAIDIFERKHPGHQAVFVFDNASTHVAKEEDALVAKRMNVNDGGLQPILRDTIWKNN